MSRVGTAHQCPTVFGGPCPPYDSPLTAHHSLLPMSRALTFGEIMLRLATPGHERIIQATSFEASYAGGEANVAVSLAAFGHDAAFLTVLPTNALGDAALAHLRY